MADHQAYLLSVFVKARCFLLDGLVGVGDQGQVSSKIQVFKC